MSNTPYTDWAIIIVATMSMAFVVIDEFITMRINTWLSVAIWFLCLAAIIIAGIRRGIWK